ncbi:hypothetical protein EST38_g7085 [Candolleomyces aberdarensis]|uniref:Uncharacterized protein n=1 Tax=Candolleomyces aberdarensis TaxID=2316362 RepID=A0A4Q2DG18_9AGAR|nr:hypothetical protein EST38_g7085 [Candolleomyces aberdarensis]
MSLEPGLFRIRAIAPPEILPEYATREEGNTSVLALPLITPPDTNQEWEASLFPDGEWTITAPGGGGWGRHKDAPGEDVLFTDTVKHWIITPNEDGGCVISIKATGYRDGAILAVTVEDGNLVINSYPLGPGVRLPAWRFIKIDRD